MVISLVSKNYYELFVVYNNLLKSKMSMNSITGNILINFDNMPGSEE